MPPWKADPADGPFVGQHPLSDAEIAHAAALGGRGRAGRRTSVGSRPVRQSSVSVDRRLAAREARSRRHAAAAVHAAGRRAPTSFASSCCRFPVETARFVRGLEFRPGNPKVVHHANIRIDTTPASRRLDEADPGPGYDGLIARSATYPDGHFLGWTPGQVAPLLPDDLAWRLEKNTDLVVELHMQPSGKAEAGRAVDRPLLRRRGADADAGDAAARAAGHRHPGRRRALHVTDSYMLPVDVEVEAVQPHAHYRAARRARRGDAARRFDEARSSTSPTGTSAGSTSIASSRRCGCRRGRPLSMRYTYDNSAANARNPQRPPTRARWGQRSADEMGDLWMQVLTRDGRRSRSPQPRLPAEGRRRGRARVRGRRSRSIPTTPGCTTMWRCCIWSLGKTTRPSRTSRRRSR